ncbi:MAG TPA: hypothetical protein VMM93_05945 [Vicinamibacterales bacterium]|nr:hypothetical protein [Vicinamibacterales bacterium]
MTRPFAIAVVLALVLSSGSAAQHMPGMQHGSASGPTQAGQAAFAAISEIVKRLEADSTTDWSKVDIEALRAHLADMDLVTLRARAAARPVDDGLAIDVTGDAEVAAAITRMVVPHATMLDGMTAWRATATPIASGTRLTVTARTPGDAGTIARIRGLGFAGLLVQGDHHTAHHLMIAKGLGHGVHDAP